MRRPPPLPSQGDPEEFYRRMRSTVNRMKVNQQHLGTEGVMRDIRELLLLLVEMVVISVEEDR